MQTPLTPPPINPHLLSLIQLAINEDLGPISPGRPHGDLTVQCSIPKHQSSTATIIARSPGTIAGTFLLNPILQHYNPNAQATILTPDGARALPNQPIAKITAPTRTLLSAERVLLNFLSHLSGIATLTHTFVAAVAHLKNPPLITDTRKTTPAFRALDKYAVRCGGGVNDRLGLYDGVMLKDNHLAALKNHLGQNQTLAQLTAHIRRQLPPNITLWLEVDTLNQFAEALPHGGADIILLDNFTPEDLIIAVELRNESKIEHQKSKIENPIPLLEASGGITLSTLPQFAATGIDRISIGALTHSAPTLDLSMELGET